MFLKNLKRKLALAGVAAFAIITLAALPAQADDPDYDYVPGSTYSAAGTVTISGGVKYGSDVITKAYLYWAIDSAGVYHRYDLFLKDKYEWKQNISDGTMALFTKLDWAYGSLKRDGIPFPGIIGHYANGQARLYPVGSSNTVYSKPLDWNGSVVQYHQHVWLTFSWQNADTRWLRESGRWTIDLPAGEKFIGCATPASEGKNVFTFPTQTTYLK